MVYHLRSTLHIFTESNNQVGVLYSIKKIKPLNKTIFTYQMSPSWSLIVQEITTESYSNFCPIQLVWITVKENSTTNQAKKTKFPPILYYKKKKITTFWIINQNDYARIQNPQYG